MKRTQLLTWSLLVACLSWAESKVTVSILESAQGQYLQTKEQSPITLEKDDLVTVATSLLNIGALEDVSPETSAKVSDIVKPSPFQKPDAVATFVVGGVQGLKELQGSAQMHAVEQKETVFNALHTLSRAASVEHLSLDLSTLHGCGEVCLETTLQEAIQALELDANYTAGSANFRGTLALRAGAEKHAAVFDLQHAADRLLAIELASTWRTVTDAATEQKRRSDQLEGSYVKPQLIERVLLGAQAMKDAYGPESQQYKVACCIQHQLITFSIRTLQEAHASKIVTIVAAVDSEDFQAGANDLVDIIDWASRSQRPSRALLQASNQSSEESYIQGFVAWIVMWGTFFLLLFFALSGCHCLKSMKFKQDSLLYGKNKTE